MRLLDVNLLIYAVDEAAPRHRAARAWVEDALSGTETVALPWTVLLAFLRLSTRSSLFEHPLTVPEALDLVDGWLAQPCVAVVHPGARHAAVLRDLLTDLGAGGGLVTDAHLAAMAIEHGALLCSTDRDFGRFPGLRWADPLAGA
ncbi:MAG TPA: TA system VapC family ribonuclease toxin [Actinomycetes bacterium]|nr:TA system VapC family ribonuclease toxin [Actinomycetes bacterium]